MLKPKRLNPFYRFSKALEATEFQEFRFLTRLKNVYDIFAGHPNAKEESHTQSKYKASAGFFDWLTLGLSGLVELAFLKLKRVLFNIDDEEEKADYNAGQRFLAFLALIVAAPLALVFKTASVLFGIIGTLITSPIVLAVHSIAEATSNKHKSEKYAFDKNLSLNARADGSVLQQMLHHINIFDSAKIQNKYTTFVARMRAVFFTFAGKGWAGINTSHGGVYDILTLGIPAMVEFIARRAWRYANNINVVTNKENDEDNHPFLRFLAGLLSVPFGLATLASYAVKWTLGFIATAVLFPITLGIHMIQDARAMKQDETNYFMNEEEYKTEKSNLYSNPNLQPSNSNSDSEEQVLFEEDENAYKYNINKNRKKDYRVIFNDEPQNSKKHSYYY